MLMDADADGYKKGSGDSSSETAASAADAD
jgi:hypothetical protein